MQPNSKRLFYSFAKLQDDIPVRCCDTFWKEVLKKETFHCKIKESLER